jgi:hypothetical protein
MSAACSPRAGGPVSHPSIYLTSGRFELPFNWYGSHLNLKSTLKFDLGPALEKLGFFLGDLLVDGVDENVLFGRPFFLYQVDATGYLQSCRFATICA